MHIRAFSGPRVHAYTRDGRRAYASSRVRDLESYTRTTVSKGETSPDFFDFCRRAYACVRTRTKIE